VSQPLTPEQREVLQAMIVGLSLERTQAEDGWERSLADRRHNALRALIDGFDQQAHDLAALTAERRRVASKARAKAAFADGDADALDAASARPARARGGGGVDDTLPEAAPALGRLRVRSRAS
jgi:hypothetical protein